MQIPPQYRNSTGNIHLHQREESSNITGYYRQSDAEWRNQTVTLEAKLIGQGDDPWGGKRAGFEAEGKIKLKDLDTQDRLGPASQEVDLIISVEGVQQK
ncbi:hypothetical protein ACLK1S_06560 [Escherichia coli]